MTGTALSDKKYRVYSEYKKSGVRFFDYIPKHWAISKVRFISSFGRGLGITKANLKDNGVPCVSYGEVHSKYGFEVDPTKHDLKCVDEEYLKTSPDALLSKGDFVFADTSEDIDGSGNFTQLVSDEILFAGYHTVVVRPNSDNYYRFLAYVFDSSEYRTQIRDAVKGVKVFSVTQAILKNTNVWLPTYEEQQKIANFLDHETAKIDTLIAKQEKLIALLKEKRQAVISHAVTRGLNPDTPMKDSDVEWLGEVPEHWVVSPLKYYSKMQGGFAFSSSDFCESGIQLLKIANVYQNRLALERQPTFLNETYLSSHNDFVVTNGDILMSLTGTLGKQDYGFAVLVEDNNEFLLNQRVAKINSVKRNICQEYLLFSLWSDSYLSQLYSLPSGTKQANLSNDDVMGIVIAFPSTIKEQQDIVQYVGTKLERFKLLNDRCTKKIDLLKERKTALISAAVTGKIDVRNWQNND